MRAILANCRAQLNAEDLRFISEALAPHPPNAANLTALLIDDTARDAALESDRALDAVMNAPRPITVSPHLYFYLLTRRTLTDWEREIADYVANVLAAFVDARGLHVSAEWAESVYVTDLLAALASAPAERTFLLHAHLANFALFMSGIFPQHLHHRATRRAAPDLSFYERVGSTSYRVASDHPLAKRHELDAIYRTMGERFGDVRRRLNRLSEDFLCLESAGGFSS